MGHATTGMCLAGAILVMVAACAREPAYSRADHPSAMNQRLNDNPTKPVPPIPPAPATGNRPPGPEY
ncbi:hypothetical protein [Nitrospira sp. Nam74]